MFKKLFHMFVLLAITGVSGWAVNASAQDAQSPNNSVVNAETQDQGQPNELDQDILYSFGTVVTSDPTKVTILEYDYDKDQDVETSFIVNPKTELVEIAAVTDLAKDDTVEIFYSENGGEKIATAIKKVIEDESSYEESSADVEPIEVQESEGDAVNAIVQ